MYWKDSLASLIYLNPHLCDDIRMWKEVGLKYPRVRYKTVDVKGKVVVMQLDGDGSWIKPNEWADLHLQSLVQRIHDDGERLLAIVPQAEAQKIVARALPNMRFVDLGVLTKLTSERDDLISKLDAATQENRKLLTISARSSQRIDVLEERLKNVLTTIETNSTITTPRAIKELVK